jgi:hypothetical protein
MDDLRTQSRTECFVPGLILCNGSKLHFDCVVWDITEAGAKLGVSDGNLIPDEISIKTAFSKQPRQARVLWRKRKEVGVQLLDE